jgi:hypothetical protein
MKSLYWQEPGQLAFRFNLAVFNKKWTIESGVAGNFGFENQPFYPWRELNYILDSDVENIRTHFKSNGRNNPKCVLGSCRKIRPCSS